MKKVGFLLGAIFVLISIFLINYNKELLFSQESMHLQGTNDSSNDTKIILKFAHNLPVDSSLHKSSLLFAKKVEEKTNGKVEVKIFPAQMLGNDYKMLELARVGKIDLLLTPTAKISPVVPSMQYVDLPFLFSGKDEAYYLLDGSVGNMLLSDLGSINLIGVTFWENGFKHFTANTPIKQPEDFKGKNIRIMKSKILMEQFEALGAKAIPIDFYKTKQALKDGVVDGQENPLTAIVAMGFHEVQSDVTLSEHGYLGYAFSISKKTFLNLPNQLQNIIIETAKEVSLYSRAMIEKENDRLVKYLKDYGVKVHTLTKAERKKFENATKHLIKQNEDLIGSHVVSKAEEMLYEKNKLNQENANIKVIGVDADISMGGKGGGLAIKRGVEMAVEEINAKGGVLGKKLLVIAKDHRGLSTQGVNNVKVFAADENVVGIIGGKHSAIVSSEIDVIQNNKIPYLIPWATAVSIIDNGYNDNYLFRVSINESAISNYLVENIMESYSKPLLIVENSIWGRGAKTSIYKELKDYLVGFHETVVVQRGEKKFETVLEQIKTKKPDSLVMVLNSPEGASLVQALIKNGIKLPLISHWGIVGDEFFQINKKHLQDIDLRFIQTFSFLNSNDIAKKVATKYLKKYKKTSIHEIKAPSAVAQAYDATHLLIKAIKKAGSFKREDVKKALESLDTYKGAVRDYKQPFSKNNHEALFNHNLFMAQYGLNGEIIPIVEQK